MFCEFCGVVFGYQCSLWHKQCELPPQKLNGTLDPRSYLVFLPYHLLNRFALFLFRCFGKEHAFDKITENLYLGSHLSRRDSQQLTALGIGAILDLTCEFSEAKALRTLPHYRNVPLLDTQAPSLNQLTDAVQWLELHKKNTPVYVHCALGHGRSATFAAAYLLSRREALTVDDALAKIMALRPKIGLSKAQMRVLQEFAATLSL